MIKDNKKNTLKIFYKVIPKNLTLSKNDIGIFIEKNKNFPGKQYILRDYKIKNFFIYQKYFQSFAKKNWELFTINDINFENTVQSFFLRTYNSFDIDSLGNILTLIDILEDIFKNTSLKNKDIICYLPNNQTKEVLSQFFKNKKTVNITFVVLNNTYFDFLRKNLMKIFFIFYFFRIILRWILGRLNLKKTLNKSSRICFLQPLEFKIDIHQKIKDYFQKNNIRFNTIKFDLKNVFFKNYLNLKYYKNLFYSTLFPKNENEIFIGQFISLKDIFYILYTYIKKLRTLKNYSLKPIKYKNITLKNCLTDFINLYKYLYLLILIESYIISRNIVKNYKAIFYSYIDDTLTETLSIYPSVNKVSLQYELIYPGCIYYFYKNNTNIELVWNEYSKKVLEKYYNYPKDKVYIIGNVRFKKIKKDKKNRKKINIVFFTQNPFPEALNMFIKATKYTHNKKLRFFIKPHPFDDIKIIKEKLEKLNLHNKIKIIEGTLEDAFKIADLCISYNSTTLLEANFNKIPCVIINPYKTEPSGVPLYKYYPYFKSCKDLRYFLNKLDLNYLHKKITFPKSLEIKNTNYKLLEKILKNFKII